MLDQEPVKKYLYDYGNDALSEEELDFFLKNSGRSGQATTYDARQAMLARMPEDVQKRYLDTERRVIQHKKDNNKTVIFASIALAAGATLAAIVGVLAIWNHLACRC